MKHIFSVSCSSLLVTRELVYLPPSHSRFISARPQCSFLGKAIHKKEKKKWGETRDWFSVIDDKYGPAWTNVSLYGKKRRTRFSTSNRRQMAEMNQFMFINSLACVRHVRQSLGVSSHHPVLWSWLALLLFLFSRRKKKIVGRMGRTFTVLVALDSCYLLGRSRKTFLFTTCRVMTGRTVSCHSCVMHFLSFHSVIFLFIRETQANSSRCVCFVLSCCILFLF